jgi:DNA-binding LytR/AlgR family response regulator
MIRCLVIDDEPLAIRGMKEYIAEVDSLNLVAAVSNPGEAIRYLSQVDLMYLDINMPVINGIDFLRQVKNPPLTIITTAYEQYALQGFELDVIDYLLKPVSFPRFLKATTKAVEYFKLLHPENTGNSSENYFFVKSNGILEKINLIDIVAVESLANYITIHTRDKKITAYLTLKQIKENLPADKFIQVHKSFIVAINKIEKIDHDFLVADKLNIPIGLNFRDVVQQVLHGRILKR